MLHNSIQILLPQIHLLMNKHQIKSAYIFGSAISDRFKESSDIDFLVNLKDGLDPVEAGEHLWNLEDELETLLKRKVDLITERSLRNPYLINEINATKQIIYGQ